MIRQLRTAFFVMVLLTVVCGLGYPLAVTGVAQAAFNGKADGSLVKSNGSVVGSSLISQSFVQPKYFHPRPSAAGNGYDPTASSGSNLGPSNEKLKAAIADRTAAYRSENDLPSTVIVPQDAIMASGSGLDPQISAANARLQAQRVATQRGIPVAKVNELIDKYTQNRSLGFLGDKGVNVLQLNLALDAPN